MLHCWPILTGQWLNITLTAIKVKNLKFFENFIEKIRCNSLTIFWKLSSLDINYVYMIWFFFSSASILSSNKINKLFSSYSGEARKTNLLFPFPLHHQMWKWIILSTIPFPIFLQAEKSAAQGRGLVRLSHSLIQQKLLSLPLFES